MKTKKQVCLFSERPSGRWETSETNIKDPFSLIRMAVSPDVNVREAIAANHHMPLAGALKLAHDDDFSVRYELACGTRSKKVLEILTKDIKFAIWSSAERKLITGYG